MLACLLAGRLVTLGGLRWLRARADLIEAFVERPALQIENLVQLALDVVEDRGEIEAVERLAALLTQALQQVAQPVRSVTVGRTHTALHHAAQRLLQVTEVEQVVGETLQDVVRVEFDDVLRAVPLAVAEPIGHGGCLPSALPAERAGSEIRRGRTRRARSCPC